VPGQGSFRSRTGHRSGEDYLYCLPSFWINSDQLLFVKNQLLIETKGSAYDFGIGSSASFETNLSKIFDKRFRHHQSTFLRLVLVGSLGHDFTSLRTLYLLALYHGKLFYALILERLN